jgi:hypothetical protein
MTKLDKHLLEDAVSFAKGEPNTYETRSMITSRLQYAAGLLFANAYDYRVVCNDSNNSPLFVNQNKLKIDIYVRQYHCVDYEIINFTIG